MTTLAREIPHALAQSMDEYVCRVKWDQGERNGWLGRSNSHPPDRESCLTSGLPTRWRACKLPHCVIDLDGAFWYDYLSPAWMHQGKKAFFVPSPVVGSYSAGRVSPWHRFGRVCLSTGDFLRPQRAVPPGIYPLLGVDLLPGAWEECQRGRGYFWQCQMRVGFCPATGPTLKTALSQICTLVGRMINAKGVLSLGDARQETSLGVGLLKIVAGKEFIGRSYKNCYFQRRNSAVHLRWHSNSTWNWFHVFNYERLFSFCSWRGTLSNIIVTLGIHLYHQ